MRNHTQDRHQQTLSAAMLMLGLALTLYLVSEVTWPPRGEPMPERHLAIETLVGIGLRADSPEEARKALSAAAAVAGDAGSSRMFMH